MGREPVQRMAKCHIPSDLRGEFWEGLLGCWVAGVRARAHVCMLCAGTMRTLRSVFVIVCVQSSPAIVVTSTLMYLHT